MKCPTFSFIPVMFTYMHASSFVIKFAKYKITKKRTWIS